MGKPVFFVDQKKKRIIHNTWLKKMGLSIERGEFLGTHFSPIFVVHYPIIQLHCRKYVSMVVEFDSGNRGR